MRYMMLCHVSHLQKSVVLDQEVNLGKSSVHLSGMFFEFSLFLLAYPMYYPPSLYFSIFFFLVSLWYLLLLFYLVAWIFFYQGCLFIVHYLLHLLIIFLPILFLNCCVDDHGEQSNSNSSGFMLENDFSLGPNSSQNCGNLNCPSSIILDLL